jgi:hypothetical protein
MIWYSTVRVLAGLLALPFHVTQSPIVYLKSGVCGPAQLMKFTVSATGNMRTILKFIIARFVLHHANV